MINWSRVKFDELGYVILAEAPMVLCSKEELEKRVADKGYQTGFWKELLDSWEQKGILN